MRALDNSRAKASKLENYFCGQKSLKIRLQRSEKIYACAKRCENIFKIAKNEKKTKNCENPNRSNQKASRFVSPQNISKRPWRSEATREFCLAKILVNKSRILNFDAKLRFAV
jgi:hypothetical protein